MKEVEVSEKWSLEVTLKTGLQHTFWTSTSALNPEKIKFKTKLLIKKYFCLNNFINTYQSNFHFNILTFQSISIVPKVKSLYKVYKQLDCHIMCNVQIGTCQSKRKWHGDTLNPDLLSLPVLLSRQQPLLLKLFYFMTTWKAEDKKLYCRITQNKCWDLQN